MEMFSLEKRRLQETFNDLSAKKKGAYRKRLFARTRGSSFKLKEGTFRSDIHVRMKFFTLSKGCPEKLWIP